MAAPRLTRKHIPPTIKAWCAEVDGIRRFLSDLKPMRQLHGDAWAVSQKRYYRDRLADLMTHPPEGVTINGNTYRIRDPTL